MNQSSKNYQKTLVVPITTQMWKLLKKISFETEISMSELARQGLKKIIKKHEKMVDEEL